MVANLLLQPTQKFLKDFCELNDLSNLIDKPTCYKNFDKPKRIDLIFTNKPSYFQHSNNFETGISDFHLLTVTEFKMEFQQLKPQVITSAFIKKLIIINIRRIKKTGRFDKNDIYSFKETILSVFNRYAPVKIGNIFKHMRHFS